MRMNFQRLYTLAYVLKITTMAVAAGFIALYVVVALVRISFPFELEWVEGSMVDHVARVVAGEPIYTPPSVEWVPAVYTPFYYWVCAPVAMITGGGFFPLRLVSLLASLGCMALLYLFVRRETRDGFAGLMAAGLFAACYRIGGSWLDLARVDSLFLLLLLATFYVLRFYRTRGGYILAAALVTLAFLTKQTALIAALGFAVWMIRRRDDPLRWIYPAFLAIFTGSAILILDLASAGWFSTYVFTISAGHNLIPESFWEYWLFDILRPLPLAVLFGILFLALRQPKSREDDGWFWGMATLGFLITAWVPRLKDGNFANDVLPAYLIIALLFGLAVSAVRGWGIRLYHSIPPLFLLRDHLRLWAMTFLYGALLLQLIALYYRPAAALPSTEDRRAGESFIKNVRETEGEVWVGHHGHYAGLAGKRNLATALAIYDVLRSDHQPSITLLMDSIDKAFREQRFSAIYVDNDNFVGLADRKEYTRAATVFPQPRVFWTVSGAPTRPLRVYVPQPQ